MKYLIEISCGIIGLAVIFVVAATAQVFADNNFGNDSADKFALADELVPLANKAASRGNDVELSSKYSEPFDARRIYTAQPAGNSVDNGAIADETQLGNELREIFSRKPEIPAAKIPRTNKPAENNPPAYHEKSTTHHDNPSAYRESSTEYRNDNTKPLSNSPEAIVLAQSSSDPLAGRPDPPKGASPDLSAISATLTGETGTETASNPQNTTPAAQPAPPTNEQHKDTTPPIMNKNDFASVVNGWLLVATIVSIAALVYVSIMAVDYHQRWIQTLTAQNDRYFATDDLAYGGLADNYETADSRNFGTDFFKPFTL